MSAARRRSRRSTRPRPGDQGPPRAEAVEQTGDDRYPVSMKGDNNAYADALDYTASGDVWKPAVQLAGWGTAIVRLTTPAVAVPLLVGLLGLLGLPLLGPAAPRRGPRRRVPRRPPPGPGRVERGRAGRERRHGTRRHGTGRHGTRRHGRRCGRMSLHRRRRALASGWFARVTTQWRTILWLTIVWVMLWGDLSVGNVLAGVIIGFAVITFFPLPSIAGRGMFRPSPCHERVAGGGSARAHPRRGRQREHVLARRDG